MSPSIECFNRYCWQIKYCRYYRFLKHKIKKISCILSEIFQYLTFLHRRFLWIFQTWLNTIGNLTANVFLRLIDWLISRVYEISRNIRAPKLSRKKVHVINREITNIAYMTLKSLRVHARIPHAIDWFNKKQ